jgi:LysR family cyn operon transcriptional activator
MLTMVDIDDWSFALRMLQMELRQLRYFVALADELSFTRAAERVHVTQSTLSHQIRQIEDEIGQPLFDRIGKRVVITAAGEALLPSATRALHEVDEGLRQLKAAAEPLVGTLRIGATHTFNVRLIPECVSAFLDSHPAVCVVVREMFAADIARAVDSGELDLGITYDPQRLDRLKFEPLYVEEMVLAVGANHAMADRRRVRLVELHRQRMVLPTGASATRRILDDAFRSVGAEPVVVAELDAVASTVSLVRQTVLGAIVSRLAVSDAQDVCIIGLESPTPLRTPGLLTAADTVLSDPMRAFVAILRRLALPQRSTEGAELTQPSKGRRPRRH